MLQVEQGEFVVLAKRKENTSRLVKRPILLLWNFNSPPAPPLVLRLVFDSDDDNQRHAPNDIEFLTREGEMPNMRLGSAFWSLAWLGP